jgi:two-component system CheB/CheR fusion protein
MKDFSKEIGPRRGRVPPLSIPSKFQSIRSDETENGLPAQVNARQRSEEAAKELQRTDEHIVLINNELAASNEELRISQEALQSRNDELKALTNTLDARVRERTSQLRMLTAELALTEERERRVLAQDLHDGLGQILAILKIKLSSIKESERRGELKNALQEIEGLIDQSNQSVRTLMMQLSPPVLQALGLAPALEWLGEEMERIYGLVVHIENHGVPIILGEPARTTIFRAVRELLINVSKHAGCKKAEVKCVHDESYVTICVTDHGNGFSYDSSTPTPVGDLGFGLISMKDRIEFIGGDMTIDSKPGCGTTVTIVFPSPHPKHIPQRSE